MPAGYLQTQIYYLNLSSFHSQNLAVANLNGSNGQMVDIADRTNVHILILLKTPSTLLLTQTSVLAYFLSRAIEPQCEKVTAWSASKSEHNFLKTRVFRELFLTVFTNFMATFKVLTSSSCRVLFTSA